MATVTTLPRKKSWQTNAERRSLQAKMAITRERVMAQMLRLREMNRRPDGSPMSQEEAARKAAISARTWQRWEAGDTVPYPKNLGGVAEKFGVSVAFFETEGTPATAPIDLSSDDRVDQLAAQFNRIERKLDALLTAMEITQSFEDRDADSPATPESGSGRGRRRRAA